jgi:uncharacterized protein YgiM (DUF1202 family)
MTRRWIWACAIAAAASAGGVVAAQSGKVVTVQVLSAKVQKTPSFIAPTAAKVVRGEQLTTTEEQKDWLKVTTKAGQTGWINRASVVDKAVALSTKPGGSKGSVSEDEVALAGRGFSPEVEAKYRSGHPELDFSHIDKIEKLDVDGGDLSRFVAEGGIGGGR